LEEEGGVQTRLSNKTVSDACERASQRYAAMPYDEANLEFSYELQGYIKAMASHGLDISTTCARITELLVMVQRAQR
jgi:hypothetical protein